MSNQFFYSETGKKIPISNSPCPRCGGERNNDIHNKERFGTCKSCGKRWFVVKGELVS